MIVCRRGHAAHRNDLGWARPLREPDV